MASQHSEAQEPEEKRSGENPAAESEASLHGSFVAPEGVQELLLVFSPGRRQRGGAPPLRRKGRLRFASNPLRQSEGAGEVPEE